MITFTLNFNISIALLKKLLPKKSIKILDFSLKKDDSINFDFLIINLILSFVGY